MEARAWVVSSVALAAIVAFAWRDVLVFGRTLVERDALRLTRPSREFLAAALGAGRFPEWFDGVNFGATFAGNPVYEVLAPLGWLIAVLPAPWGFDASNVLHVLIAGLGTAAFSRGLGASPLPACVAGAALALGGYVTSMVPNGLAPAMAWTPWVAWAALRLAGTGSRGRSRAALVFAAIFALQVHAGEPASLLVAALLACVIVVTQALHPLGAVVTWLAATAMSGMLAAVVVCPGVRLLAGSARAAGLDAGGLEWSLHPARLIELAWPLAFGSPRGDGWFAGLLLREGPGDPCWSTSLYVGLPILLSAAAAWSDRPARRLMWVSPLFLVLAAGPWTPVYPVLLRILPPLHVVNFPEKFVFGALLLGVAAAGVGLTRLLRGEVSTRFRAAAVVATLVLAACALAATLGRVGFEVWLERRAAEWNVLMRPGAGVAGSIHGAWVAVAAAALFVLALGPGRRWPRVSTAVLVLATLAPLVWNAGAVTSLTPRSVVEKSPLLLAPLQRRVTDAEAPRPRLFRLDPRREGGPFADGAATARYYHETLDTNLASRFGVAVVPGFLPGESAFSRRFGRDVLPGMDKLAFVRLFGIEWLAAQNADRLSMPFETVAHGPEGWTLLSTGRVRPRGFVAPRWRSVDTPDEALEGLLGREHDDDPAVVTLVRPDPDRPQRGETLSPCRVRAPRPERVRMDCASLGGYAVLLDEWAEGWTATVDGREAPIVIAEGLFRAVPIDPGAHAIVFRYRTPGLRAGATISLLAWLGWAAALAATATSSKGPSGPRGAGSR